MNEAQGYRLHSNLTPQQQKEAMENLYGAGGSMSPNVPPNFNEQPSLSLTYEEQQKMRQYLDMLAQKEAGVKEFDLAKPPIPQYQYREFPYMLYDHRNRKSKAAQNHMEREAMLAQGWTREPLPPEAVEAPDLPILAADLQEAQLVDTLLKMPKEQREELLASVRGENPGSESKKKK